MDAKFSVAMAMICWPDGSLKAEAPGLDTTQNTLHRALLVEGLIRLGAGLAVAKCARARRRGPLSNKSQGAANMDEDHETRRKIIRQWMALPKDKRQTEEQVVGFAKTAVEQNEFHRSRRDPDHKFRRDPYQKVMGWLMPRAIKS
jgi:hypothetical protein